jgi:hypothetical protein
MSGKQTDPTPEQIRLACLLIQSRWSDDEKLKRLRVDLRPQYRRADGRQQVMSNADYNVHHEQREELQEAMSDG